MPTTERLGEGISDLLSLSVLTPAEFHIRSAQATHVQGRDVVVAEAVMSKHSPAPPSGSARTPEPLPPQAG